MIIGVIILILQIPAYYVRQLIEERETTQQKAIAEVNSKWAGRQNVAGPLLVIPYWENENTPPNSVRTRHYAYFLPDQLNINASVIPQERYRGIYKVMLYNSRISFSGSFNQVALEALKIAPENVIWNECYVRFQLSDSKGLNDEVALNWNNETLLLSPNTGNDPAADQGLTAPLKVTGIQDLQQIRFAASVNLNGSEQLLFTPLGKTTSVTLQSKWPHPSFMGDVLPQTTSVKDSGFTASWKSLAIKRSFPQQWKDNQYVFNTGSKTAEGGTGNIYNAAFGTDLFIPVNGYQKTMRSVKYALLCILLTFASFFLIETSHQKSVHPFQYGLIGLALILFYTLLLSFSEYIGFNAAYGIASLATIGLIAWFVKGLLVSGRLSLLMASILILVYTYVFSLLQLQDYSLLLGSVGLFISLGVIMYFSRKFQW
jgi:inner membrane protein